MKLKNNIRDMAIILLCLVSLASNFLWDNLKLSGICGMLMGLLGFMNIVASKKRQKDKKN